MTGIESQSAAEPGGAPQRTGAALLAEAVRALREAGVADAAGDGRRLLAHALGIPLKQLTLVLPDAVDAEISGVYRSLLRRRMNREPVSHLVGSRVFWGRDFLVNSDVLDPRPETETLIAVALEEPFGRVIDLGTGSGCILVTLLSERPHASGIGLDVSAAALEIARRNAARHGVADRAVFFKSDWLEAASGTFDLIVSNPPYISAAEMLGLEPEVRLWEPRAALTDEGDGLGAYRTILSGARAHLASGGRLLLEHGPTQASAIAEIGKEYGFPVSDHRLDFDGRQRVCLFRAP